MCDELGQINSLNTCKSEHEKRIIHERNEIRILTVAQICLHISMRQIEREIGVNQNSVFHILYRHKFHSYYLIKESHCMEWPF